MFAVEPFTLKPFTTISIIVFVVAALVHLHRLLFEWNVTVDGTEIPLWVSALGVAIPGGLVIVLWREKHR